MSAPRLARRELLKRLGLAAMGGVLAGCKPQVVEKVLKETVEVKEVVKETVEVSVDATPVPLSAQKAELRIAGWFDKGTQATVDKQLELFNARFPNVKVSTVVIPFEPDKSVVMLASGAGPDVFWVNNDQTATWASRAAIYPLDELIAKDNVDLSDFYDIGKTLYSYQSKTYAVAEYLGPLMLFVNPVLFDEAGVTLPPHDYQDPSWTLDSLLEKAMGLTKRPSQGPAEQYGFYVATGWTRWYPFLLDFGGAVMDNWEEPTEIVFNSPETVAAIQWVADLRLKHGVTSTAAEEEGMPYQAQFTTGKVAMLVEGGWMWPFFSAPEVLEKVPWEVYPLPKGPKGQWTRMAGDGYGMAARSKYPEMAWELLKFVTVGDGAKVFWERELCKGIPPTRNAANDPSFLEWFAESGSRKTILDLLDYSAGTPKHPNWPEMSAKIAPALGEVFTGQRPVAGAVEEAHAAIAEVWDRVNASS